MVIPTHRIQAMSGAFFAIIVFHQLCMKAMKARRKEVGRSRRHVGTPLRCAPRLDPNPAAMLAVVAVVMLHEAIYILFLSAQDDAKSKIKNGISRPPPSSI
jgi:hypothetical protein